MHLNSFYSYSSFILWKLFSFLRVSFYTRTHTKMYDHAPQKHLTNIQVMPLSPQSTTFRGGLFSQGLWLMYISRLVGSHNHLRNTNTSTPPGKAVLTVPLGHMARTKTDHSRWESISRWIQLCNSPAPKLITQLTHTNSKTTARSRLL